MKNLIWALAVLICPLFAASYSAADIVVTLTDAGAAGVTMTFSGGTGNWSAGQPDMIFGDSTDSFLSEAQSPTFSSGVLPLGIDFGGITGLTGGDSFYVDVDGLFGYESAFQIAFTSPVSSGPSGTPAMSELDGVSVTFPGWDFADFNLGSYNGLAGLGGVDGQTITLHVIPEPTTPLAFMAGATLFAFVRRRRRR